MKRQKQERNEALLSMDKEKILAYCSKYHVPIPDNEIVFWAGIHKAITAMRSAPEEQKQKSREWLWRHGMSSFG